MAVALGVGYLVALAGTLWDDLEHQSLVELGPGFAHLMIYIGYVVLLVALIALWKTRRIYEQANLSQTGRGAAVGGILVLLTGIVVDFIWHGANPDASEENMLLLPGHAIQHVGLIVGLIGSVMVMLHARMTSPRTDTDETRAL